MTITLYGVHCKINKIGGNPNGEAWKCTLSMNHKSIPCICLGGGFWVGSFEYQLLGGWMGYVWVQVQSKREFFGNLGLALRALTYYVNGLWAVFGLV